VAVLRKKDKKAYLWYARNIPHKKYPLLVFAGEKAFEPVEEN
jgi:hypothetical protein